jgi:hypothetical protein
MLTWMKRGAIWLAGACVLGLSACTTYVDTQVTAFSAWNAGAPRTYAFSHAGLAPQDALEQQAYETVVDGELVQYGFHNVAEHDAHYLVTLDWGTQSGQETVREPVYYNDPVFCRPFWCGNPFGPWGMFPEYVTTSYPVFDHMLALRITDRSNGQDVYKVTAVNRGGDPSLVKDMPYLAHAALAGFPLANGVTHVVRVPLGKPGQKIAPEPASGAAAATQ